MLDSIIGSNDNLLIIVPPFINSLLASIVLLNERFKNGLITHLTLLTLNSLNELGDTIEKYNSVLFIDPPTIASMSKIEKHLNNKAVIVVSGHDVDWVNADIFIEYTDSLPQLIWQSLNNELSKDSMRFLEASVIYESTIVPNYDISVFNGWLTTESYNYPALPGILRLPLSVSLSRAFSPIIPGITGNENEAKNLVRAIAKRTDAMYKDLNEEQVFSLFKYLGDFVLKADFRGDYLDKLMFVNRKWGGIDVDVLDSILAIEAQLVLWEYVNGIMSPILNPESVKDTDNLVTKYVLTLGSYINQVLKGGNNVSIDYGQPLSLIDRLCSMMSFHYEKQSKSFLPQGAPYQVLCVFDEDVKDADLLFKRHSYSIAVKGLFNEDQR
jgi:hypothetical protein